MASEGPQRITGKYYGVYLPSYTIYTFAINLSICHIICNLSTVLYSSLMILLYYVELYTMMLLEQVPNVEDEINLKEETKVYEEFAVEGLQFMEEVVGESMMEQVN